MFVSAALVKKMGQRGAMIKSLFVLQSSVCLSLVVNLDHYVSLQALTKTSSHEKENEHRLTGDSGDDIFFIAKRGAPPIPSNDCVRARSQ